MPPHYPQYPHYPAEPRYFCPATPSAVCWTSACILRVAQYTLRTLTGFYVGKNYALKSQHRAK